MKIINDTPFEAAMIPGFRGDGSLCVTVVLKASYTIQADGQVRKAIDQLPINVADEFTESGALLLEADTVPYKPATDILLLGKAYSPNAVPVQSLDVSMQVGKLKKRVRVFGDRHWKAGGFFSGTRMSDAEPFTEMDLSFANCFGGINTTLGAVCLENTVGKGFVGDKVKESQLDGLALPNLENPEKLIKSWKDTPAPHGLGVVSRNWLPRGNFLGTYDEKWEKARSPKPPLDFSEKFNNCAPVDQQVAGYLNGDEQVVLTNLSPTKPIIQFNLPGLSPKAVLQDKEVDFERPVNLVLDTLTLMLEESQFTLVWRGNYAISDISELYFQSVLIKV